MAKVNVRELARNTSRVIDMISRTGQPVLVTRGGLPVGALVPIDADALDAWLVANMPDSVEGVPILRVSPFTARRKRSRYAPRRRAAQRSR